jgi:cation:H+ antiporter
MVEMFWHLFTIIMAFVLVWVASDYVLKSVDHVASRLQMSAFATSFIILGTLTSLPEVSIGMNAVAEGVPGVFVGNLIGASFVIFTFVIPLLAILGNGITLAHQLSTRYLVFALFVIIAPAILIVNGAMTRSEGVLLMVLYLVLIVTLEKHKSFREKIASLFHRENFGNIFDIVKIAAGAIVIFFSSRLLVNEALHFADVFSIPPVLIGLIVLAIGTNIPELFLGIKSILSQQKDVAFGDYIGSAAANTFIFGLLTVVYGPFKLPDNGFLMTSVLLVVGMCLFFFFGLRNGDISRKEALLLLSVYVLFIVVEVVL